jgi:2-methylcitrate dehydratase PrpD
MTTIDDLAGRILEESTAPVTRLNLSLLDIAASMLAGSATSEAKPLAAHLAGGAWSASIPDRVALAVAMTRLSEVDDIHMASCTTPGSVVVPTALLVGAHAEQDVRTFARAMLAGYRVMMRLGRGVDGPRILYRGIWPTYLLAPAGAAATAAVLLGAGQAELAKAIALALNLSSGGAGGHVKGVSPRWMLAGLAAANGVRAARAACDGFSPDLSLLDGDWLEKVHGLPFDRARALADKGCDLGDLSMKPVCAAKQTIAALDAFRTLLARGIDPLRIESIRIGVPNDYVAMISGRGGVASRLSRMTTIAYHCALAAFEPDLLNDVERVDRTGDPRIAALMSKVEVTYDPQLDHYFPERWPARVTIVADGKTESLEIVDALGDPGRPLEGAAFEAKFTALTAPVIRQNGAQRLFVAGLGALFDNANLSAFQNQLFHAIPALKMTK